MTREIAPTAMLDLSQIVLETVPKMTCMETLSVTTLLPTSIALNTTMITQRVLLKRQLSLLDLEPAQLDTSVTALESARIPTLLVTDNAMTEPSELFSTANFSTVMEEIAFVSQLVEEEQVDESRQDELNSPLDMEELLLEELELQLELFKDQPLLLTRTQTTCLLLETQSENKALILDSHPELLQEL